MKKNLKIYNEICDSITRNDLENIVFLVSKYKVKINLDELLSVNVTYRTANQIEIAKYFIEQGADVKGEGCDALFSAVTSGNLEMMNLLIDKGSGFEIKHVLHDNNEVIFQDILLIATEYSQLEIVKELIVKYKKDPEIALNYYAIDKNIEEWVLNYTNSFNLKSKLDIELINKEKKKSLKVKV